MDRLISAELFKIRKRWMPWILLGILVAFLSLLYLISYRGLGTRLEASPDQYTFPDAYGTVLFLAQSIGGVLLVILAASVIGNEYGWGTAKGMLTRIGNRYHYLAAKMVVLLIVVLLGLVISLVVGSILASYTTIRINGGISTDFLTASFAASLAKMFGWTFLALCAYVLLAILVAVLGRSAALGIGVSIGYYFVERIIIAILLAQEGSWLAKVPQYMLGQNVNAVMSFSHFGETPVGLPSSLHGTVYLLIYCLVFVVLSFHLFQQRDLID
jgi:ABC-2 type transport system permease protein